MSYITQHDLAKHENVEIGSFETSSFLYSFYLLPHEEKCAMHSVYAFCSYIDEIVDSSLNIDKEVIKKKIARLAWWEIELEKIYEGRSQGSILDPFIRIIERFEIPKQYFLTLIDGCKRDLTQNRYETIEEVKEYCYGVASIVGLITIEILGHKYEDTKNYAINLGYALQLTNIMRDIKVDKDRNYIYLPLEDLRRFNYSEEDIMNEVYNDNYVELMRFQAKRAREYYHKARTYLRPDERPKLFAAEIMDSIYYRLLEKIELNDFDVYSQKIKVSTSHKLLTALKHWVTIRFFVSRIKNQP